MIRTQTKGKSQKIYNFLGNRFAAGEEFIIAGIDINELEKETEIAIKQYKQNYLATIFGNLVKDKKICLLDNIQHPITRCWVNVYCFPKLDGHLYLTEKEKNWYEKIVDITKQIGEEWRIGKLAMHLKVEEEENEVEEFVEKLLAFHIVEKVGLQEKVNGSPPKFIYRLKVDKYLEMVDKIVIEKPLIFPSASDKKTHSETEEKSALQEYKTNLKNLEKTLELKEKELEEIKTKIATTKRILSHFEAVTKDLTPEQISILKSLF